MTLSILTDAITVHTHTYMYLHAHAHAHTRTHTVKTREDKCDTLFYGRTRHNMDSSSGSLAVVACPLCCAAD